MAHRSRFNMALFKGLLALSVIVFCAADNLWGQGCSSLLGYDNLGGHNQYPNAVAVVGGYAYTADMFGLTIYDVRNPASPVRTGDLFLPVWGAAVAVSGNTAYVADWSAGLQIVDVGDVSRPRRITSFETSGLVQDVQISEDVAYLASGMAGLQMIDISEPAQPKLLGSYTSSGSVSSATISGGLAYLTVSKSGISGIAIVDISDPTHPSLAGSYDTPGFARGVAVDGTTAYVAEGTSGLQALDVSDPAHPVSLGIYDTPDSAVDVAVAGQVAYVADSRTGLLTLDISDPSRPVLLDTCDTPGYLNAVTLHESLAYLADNYRSLTILDLRDPAKPVGVGAVDLNGSAIALALSGKHALVANGWRGLQVLDIGDPAQPFSVASSDVSGFAVDIAASGNLAFLAANGPGLRIFDLQDPTEPRLIGSFAPAGIKALSLSAGRIYTAAGGAGLQIFDVSDPSNPVLAGSYDTPGFALDVAAAGTVAYVADGDHGLQIIDASDPSQPVLLGSYDTPGTAAAIAVSGQMVYIADWDQGLQIIDVHVPSHPTLAGSLDIGGFSSRIAAWGNLVFLNRGCCDLLVIDISDPMQPEVVTTLRPRRPVNDFFVDPGTSRIWLAEGVIVEAADLACATCTGLGVAVDPPGLLASGETSTITVTVKDVLGNPVADAALTGATDLGDLSAFTGKGDGSYQATFTSGATAGTATITVSVEGTPCATTGTLHVYEKSPAIGHPGAYIQMLSASAHVSGLSGTSWVSDLVLWNGNATTARANLYFLHSGHNNSGAKGRVISVPAGASVKLTDVVHTMFGQSHASGAILVGSDQELTVTSRTYNDATTGTYGQFIAGVPMVDATGTNTPVRLIQLTRNEAYRTNIGFANGTGSTVKIEVDLFGADGTPFGARSFKVAPYGFHQETDIIGADVADGYALVGSSTPGAAFFTYASVIDNRTGDPVFVTPGAGTASSGEDLYIPGSAHVKGAGGTHWRTDVEVHNPGTATASYVVELLKRDTKNDAPESKSFTLPPGHSVRFEDALDTIFGFTGAASLRIHPTAGTITVTSRTYNQASAGTYGQLIPAVPAARSIAAGEAVPIVQLAESDSTSSGYRTNLGLVNTTGGTISVDIDLHDGDGTRLGTKQVTLRAHEYRQVDRVFRPFSSSTLESCYAVVKTSSSGGSFLAYGSVVDNRSGDPVYVPATGGGGSSP